jgi:hypothetical protein
MVYHELPSTTAKLADRPEAMRLRTVRKLSPTQESRLADWIRVQDELGFAPTHAQIRTSASRILFADGSAMGVGKPWLEGFLQRNPHVQTLLTRLVDNARANGATVEVI